MTMTDLATLKTVLRIEEAQTAGFRRLYESVSDPLAKAVFRILADDENTHAGWVRELIAERENSKNAKTAQKSGRKLTLEELRGHLGDEEGEEDWFGQIARESDDPVVRLVLTRIAEDEGRNAKLVKELMAHLSGEV